MCLLMFCIYVLYDTLYSRQCAWPVFASPYMSPYLFILAVEILSSKIRDSENVRGIQIDNCEI